MKKLFLILALFSFIFASIKVHAAPDDRNGRILKSSAAIPVETLKKKISGRMSDVKTVSFNFVQKTHIAQSTQTVAAAVYFRRPEELVLKYTRPDIQEIYISTVAIFTYIPSIGQATKQSREQGNIDNIAGVTLSVIFNGNSFGYLDKNFSLSAFELNNSLLLRAMIPSQ